jgi:DNA mismatch repair protein MutS
MIELALLKRRVTNLTMAVREWNDTIVFLRRVLDGAADRSYGIQVARLAGLPREVIDRAREVLSNLEREELSRDGRPKLARGHAAAPGEAAGPAPGTTTPAPAQLGLFAPADDPIVEEIRNAKIDEMTPIQALNLLADLRKRLSS